MKLNDLIRDARVAMLTTVGADGSLRSRPMIACRGEEGGLWFFTHAGDAKVGEALTHPRVNVCYADPGRGRYVSVCGTAELVGDRETMRRLWHEEARAWFPRGPEEPDLALLRVRVDHAEYWDGSGRGGHTGLEAS